MRVSDVLARGVVLGVVSLLLGASVALAADRRTSGEPIRAEKTFLATFDGSRQSYIELEPVPFKPESGALIALHGHGSDRHQCAEHPRGECRALREAAASRGMLSTSLRSWRGDSSTAPSLNSGMLYESSRRECSEGFSTGMMNGLAKAPFSGSNAAK